MKKILSYTALLMATITYGQGENDNWYFGHNAGLNFSTNPPTALFDGQIHNEEAAASISDSQGNLLFYTDGATVWNRTHQIMLNGTGLLATSTTQQIAIVPFPGNNNLYYIFTTGTFDNGTNNFSYSIVDMSLGSIGTNGLPLGGITNKNTAITNELGQPFPFISECVTMVSHSDNKSYWVLFTNGGNLYSYRITSAGFNPAPVVSTIPGTPGPTTAFSHIRISPELSADLNLNYSHLIAFTRWYISTVYDVRVFSFDNTTGLITIDYLFQDPGAFGPAYSEFSQDGTLLYTSSYRNQKTFVYNLFASDLSNIANIRRSLYSNPYPQEMTGVALQRTKNGDIYFSLNTGTTLARILNPDSFLNSSVDVNNFALGNMPTRGFPQMVPILSTAAGSACWENLTLGTPETTNITRQVSSSITTNNSYRVSSGRSVNLKGGDFILMLPNSVIESGSEFVVEIDGCLEGVNSNKTAQKTCREPFRLILTEADSLKEMTIYPNPSSDKTTISIENENIVSITISTIEGKTVFTNYVSGQSYRLDASQYANGIYIITAETQSGKLYSKKLIVK